MAGFFPFSTETLLGLTRSGASTVALSYGSLTVPAIAVKATANGSFGTGTLSVGSAKVSTTYVKTGDVVMLVDQGGGSNLGSLQLNGITSGTSFAVLSSNAADSNIFAWWIVRPQ